MVLFFVSRLLASGLALVAFIILPRIMLPAEFGEFNMLVQAGTLGFALLLGWGPAVIVRYHRAASFGGMATAWALGLSAALTVVLALVLGAGLLPLEADLRLVVLLAAVFGIGHGLNEVGLAGFRVYGDSRGFAAAVLLRPVLGGILAVVFVLLGWGVAGAVVGMALGAGAPGLWAVLKVARWSVPALPGAAAIRQFLNFGLPLALVASGATVIVLTTQAIMAGQAGLADVGIYAAAQTLALRGISMPMVMFSRTTSAEVFQAYEERGRAAAGEALARYLSFLLLISVPLVMPMTLANDTVARLLFDENFRDGVAMHLPWLAFAAFLGGIQGGYFAYAFTIGERTKVQLLIASIVAVVHVGLCYALIWVFGPIGASYAVLISSVFDLALYYWLGRRVVPFVFPRADIGKVVLATLVSAPFPLMAESQTDTTVALALIAAGLCVFCLVLHLARQTAMRVVVSRVLGRVARAQT